VRSILDRKDQKAAIQGREWLKRSSMIARFKKQPSVVALLNKSDAQAAL
jgi:hypothetical protein